MLKLVDKIWWEKKDFCIISKYLPIRHLLIKKGKVVTIMWKYLVNTTLTKWTKLTLIIRHQNHLLSVMKHQERHSIIVLLSKMHNLNLILRNFQTNLNWRMLYKTTNQESSKLSSPRERNKDLNCHKLEEKGTK